MEQKFDSDRNQFDIKNRVHAMAGLENKGRQGNKMNKGNGSDSKNDPSSPNATNRGQSLSALSDGHLNLVAVIGGKRTDKIIISVNNGCLSANHLRRRGGRATLSLNVNCAERYNEPFVHFEIHTINNDTEYNAKINYDNGTKK